MQVYGGAFPPGVRGLYIVGWAQARNGFGRLITPLADLYARMIALQDELEFPLGTVMEQSFTQRLPTTHLVDPEKARREIRIAHWILPLLKVARPADGAETKTQDADNASVLITRIDQHFRVKYSI